MISWACRINILLIDLIIWLISDISRLWVDNWLFMGLYIILLLIVDIKFGLIIID